MNDAGGLATEGRNVGDLGVSAETPGRGTKEFVGRERELAELVAGLGDAIGGRTRLFLVSGHPGIGKTRLVDELSGVAREKGALVCWGRAWEGGGAPPSWPWVQVLRGLLRGVPSEGVREHLGNGAAYLAQLLPELRSAVPDIPALPGASIEPENTRFYLFDAVAGFLRSVAAIRPLVIVLDDLHSADPASLRLLQFVAREIRESRILLAGTFRKAEEREPPLATVLGEILREGNRMDLAPLGEAEVGRLIAAAAGFEASSGVVRAVYRATEGNPFFVDGVVRLLLAEGKLSRGGKRPPASLRIPEEVRESVRGRLRRLSEDTERLLTIGAVVGRELDLTVLESASGLGRERVLEVVEEARAAAIVDPVSAALGRYRFSHALIRETLYDDLAAGRRVELHRRVGELFESLYRTHLESHLPELAHHFFEAIASAGADRAIDYAIRAGRQAAGAFSWEDAVREFERARLALELSPSADDRRRVEILIHLAEALWYREDLNRSREVFDQALEIARRTGDVDSHVRVIESRCFYTLPEAGRHDKEMIRLIEEALDRIGEEETVRRAMLLSRLGSELEWAPGQLERRSLLLRKAVSIARRIGDPTALAGSLLRLGQMLIGGQGSIEERQATAEEASRWAIEAGHRRLTFVARLQLLLTHLELGDMASFDREFEVACRFANQARSRYPQSVVRNLENSRALLQGNLADLEARAEEALALGMPTSPAQAMGTYGALMLNLRRAQGRSAELEPVVRASVERGSIAAWRPALALVLTESGREAEARAEFELLAADGFASFGQDFLLSAALAPLALVCARLGDARRAALLYSRILPLQGRNLVVGLGVCCEGPADRFLGLLASTMGRHDDAEAHFLGALELCVKMGARPHAAETQRDYARMLLARGGEGDREKALGLLDQALETARRLGMKRVEEDAGALRAAAGPSAPPKPADPAAAKWSDNAFRNEGDFWSVTWQGTTTRVKDMKGLHYILRLLREPGREIHCADLLGDGIVDAGGAGAVLDTEAKAAYRRRIEDLEDELEEAERFGDVGRAARAREEIDFIGRELAAAVGLGGRDRKAGRAAERMRIAVTRNIRGAVARIREQNPALGHHLDTSIRTGAFCSYVPGPDSPVVWAL